MMYNHTYNGDTVNSIKINGNTLKDRIISYEIGHYTLFEEMALMHYLYITGNYRYKRINDFVLWGVITKTSLNPSKYWDYFESNLEQLEVYTGDNYSKLKKQIKKSKS